MFHSQTVELQSPRYRGFLFGAGVYRRIVGHHRDRSRSERMINHTLRFKCHENPHARPHDLAEAANGWEDGVHGTMSLNVRAWRDQPAAP
jgi:hypothetical protein